MSEACILFRRYRVDGRKFVMGKWDNDDLEKLAPKEKEALELALDWFGIKPMQWHPIVADDLERLLEEARSTFNQDSERYSAGQYPEESAVRNAKKFNTALGSHHPETVRAWNLAGASLAGNGKFLEAEAVLRKTLAAYRLVLGDSLKTLTALHNLAVVVGHRSERESERLLRQVIADSPRINGPDAVFTVVCKASLAENLFHQSRLAEAEVLAREAMNDLKRAGLQRDRDALYAMGMAVHVFVAQGRLLEAKVLAAEVLAESERLLPARHPRLTDKKVMVADIDRRLGKYDAAEEPLRAAVESLTEMYSRCHRRTAGARMAYAQLLADTGRRERADEEYDSLRRCLSDHVGFDHRLTLIVDERRAVREYTHGKSAAGRLFGYVAGVRDETAGPFHLRSFRNRLQHAAASPGGTSRFIEEVERMAQDALALIRRTAIGGAALGGRADLQLLSQVDALQPMMSYILPLVIANDQLWEAKAARLAVRWQGIVLRAQRLMRESRYLQHIPAVKRWWGALLRYYALKDSPVLPDHRHLDSSEKRALARQQTAISAAADRIVGIERRLGGTYPVLAQRDGEREGLRQICNELERRRADMVVFSHYHKVPGTEYVANPRPSGNGRYVAFVLRGQGACWPPKQLEFEAADVDAAISRYRSSLMAEPNADGSAALDDLDRRGHEVFRRFIQPLIGDLEAGRPLYVVPAGEFEDVPLGTLPTREIVVDSPQPPQWRYLLEDRPVVRLAYPAAVLHKIDTATKGTHDVMVRGLDLERQKRQPWYLARPGRRPPLFDGTLSASCLRSLPTAARRTVNPRPSTALRPDSTIPVHEASLSSAYPDVLLRRLKGARIVHLDAPRLSVSDSACAHPDALATSYLMLSGAGERGLNGADRSRRVLSARDIANHADLRASSLVVLAGGGVGEGNRHDLAHALFIAGADTVIAPAGRTQDARTDEFLAQVYSALLKAKSPPHLTLRAAQLAWLKSTRETVGKPSNAWRSFYTLAGALPEPSSEGTKPSAE